MKKLLPALAISFAALLPTVAAMAADLDVPPPPVEELRPATYDWTGLYFGGWVGLTCVDGELTDNTPVTGQSWEMSGCGHKAGVLAGYNHQFDNFVIGVEGDWARTNDIATNEEPGADFAFSMDSIATLRARFGLAMDDTMFFATAGGAWAKGNLDGIIAAVPDNIKGNHFGWTIGGGVEHAVTDSFRIKLDYLFTKFRGDSYSEACCDVDIDDFKDHEVRLGAIWAF
jgi:outer membrane immunogenic protein